MDMAMEMSSQLFLRNKSKTSNYILTITFKEGEDFGASESHMCRPTILCKPCKSILQLPNLSSSSSSSCHNKLSDGASVVFYLRKGSGYRAFRIFGPSHQPIGLGTGP
jgi:hypothetical protein